MRMRINPGKSLNLRYLEASIIFAGTCHEIPKLESGLHHIYRISTNTIRACSLSGPAPVSSTVIDNLSSTPLPGQFGTGPTFLLSGGHERASIFESGPEASHTNSITLRFATYADSFLISLRSVAGGLPLDSSLATDPLSIQPARELA